MMIINSPIGKLALIETNGNLSAIHFEEMIDWSLPIKETQFLKQCAVQLEEYFSGKRKIFDIPILLQGTKFQVRVWEALLKIPYGEVRSYQELAHLIGNIKACRAVGMANSQNPIPIVIPCHRVVGKNGRMIGYAGGIDKKEFLLKLEKAYL